MYRLALDHKARQIVLIAGILLAASLLALVLHRSASAQDNTIEFEEHSKDAVATFSADDPEGATPIAWYIVAAGTDPDGDGDLTGVDNADAPSFGIDKDGVLKFSSAPDFENPATTNATSNTYKVVVIACDVALEGDPAACPATGKAAYHAVTVKVINVEEAGKVTLSTSTTGGTPQYLVGATLTAEATDGDITDADQDFTVDRAGEVTGVTWRWYRGAAEITTDDAKDNTYTLVADDADENIRAVVHYIVTGNVDQETAEKTTEYTVLEARVGANKLKFDPAALKRTISEGDKGRNVGAPVTATGNHGTVEYTLEGDGADNSRFEIDKKTGQITSNQEFDFEAATDATNCGGNDDECVVTVRATDSYGDAAATATTAVSATAVSVDATVTITITNVDETPTFSTGAKAITVPENSTALHGDTADGFSIATADIAAAGGVTYTAADPETRTVSYSLAGPDRSKFQLSGVPPVLSFATKPDFEAKASADRDNVYEVTVQASVGNDTGERNVKVTVRGVDEGPEITGPAERNFVENGTGPVATYTAVDPEGVTPIAWSLASAAQVGAEDDIADADNADAADHFEIDKDGVLKFSSAPDFENPSGEGGTTSNTYKVVVVACDVAADDCTGGQIGFHKVTVKVTNIAETGKVTLATDTPGTPTPQYLVAATLTATASDGDITDSDQTFGPTERAGEVTGITWRWYRGGSLISDARANTYTIQPEDAGKRIRAVVTYKVEGNTNQESASKTTEYNVLAARTGDNGLKFDPAAIKRTISEGEKGRNVGNPVTATGNHGTIRYSLADSDDAASSGPKFKIDEKTGQISTLVELDYEGDSEATATAAGSCAGASAGSPDRECTVTVVARDSTGDTTSTAATNLNATVTITITNVDETPTFSTGAKAITVPENSTALHGDTADGFSIATTDIAAAGGVTYMAADPEGRTVNYSLAGPDASKFQLSNTPPVLSFVSKPDFEAKASADGDNVYEVTVQASVGSDTGTRDVRVTVSNVDEAPEITVAPASGIRISGDTSVSVQEGTTAVETYTASGPDAASARWSVSGGADRSAFTIGSRTGVLTFRTAPDYETPGSADNDNTYSVTVSVRDSSGNTDDHAVTVTVTDVDETVPGGQTIADRYDANNNNVTEKDEVIAAINDYLDGGSNAPSKADVISLINRYLDG